MITFLASAIVVSASGKELPIPRIVNPMYVLLSLNMIENRFKRSINNDNKTVVHKSPTIVPIKQIRTKYLGTSPSFKFI